MTTCVLVGVLVAAWGVAAERIGYVFQRLDRGARIIRIEKLEADVMQAGLAFADWPVSRCDWHDEKFRRYVLPLYRTLGLPS